MWNIFFLYLLVFYKLVPVGDFSIKVFNWPILYSVFNFIFAQKTLQFFMFYISLELTVILSFIS